MTLAWDKKMTFQLPGKCVQGEEMSLSVNQVVSDLVTLNPLTGAGHGGVTDPDIISINDSRDRENQEREKAFILPSILMAISKNGK